MIIPPVKFLHAELKGSGIIHKSTRIGDLKDYFKDETKRMLLPQDKIIYEVQAYLPVDEGTLGGLFFGITKIHSGKVGNEYFMTRGHFHEVADRGEYYWGIKGQGALILMDRNRKVRAELMHEGSLHYIPAYTAHRVANTGDDELSFGACWPADAGHNYAEIAEHGFSGRVVEINGLPQLITED